MSTPLVSVCLFLKKMSTLFVSICLLFEKYVYAFGVHLSTFEKMSTLLKKYVLLIHNHSS